MATRMFLLSANGDSHLGYGYPNLLGTATGMQPQKMLTTRGGGVVAGQSTSTVTGPTAGIIMNGTFSFGVDWMSLPVAADITISGTITANIWCAENNMSANAAINVWILIARANDDGSGYNTLQEIVKSTFATEMAVTTRAVNNFTTGMTSGSYTARTINRGDRIIIRPFMDDAGTMATGFTTNMSYNGATAAADGDSWVEFTENITFETTDPPTGSTVYFTNTASDVSTSAVDRRAWTSRGAGVQTDAVGSRAANHVAVPLADDHIEVGAVFTAHADGVLDGSADRAAQSFTATISGEIWTVAATMSKNGTPTDNVTFELQGDSGGSPDGVALASVTVAASTITAGGNRQATLTFPTPATVVASTTYWIVAYRTGSTDASNFCRILGNGTSIYAGGIGKNSTNSGGSWNTNAGLLDLGMAIGYGPVAWFTPQLQAVTLGGMAKANLRLRGAGGAGGSQSARCEVAVVDADGSNPVIWGTWCIQSVTNDAAAVSTAAEEARTVYLSGDDISITEGQRLRIRVLEEDQILGDSAGGTLSFFYAGTSGGASGDSFIIFPQTLTEYTPPAAVDVAGRAPQIVNPAQRQAMLVVRER